jgi:hypothetical protein
MQPGLVTRRHTGEAAWSRAVYSDCGAYRYSLARTWDRAAGRLLFVMLNPSTASEVVNDPTVERCEQRTRRLGYGGFEVTNLFAFRATDPRDLRAAAEPVGPLNDAVLARAARRAIRIVAAWGVHGAHRGRGQEVAAMLRATGRPLCHLGLSKEGHPRHPLYLPYARQPEAWLA